MKPASFLTRILIVDDLEDWRVRVRSILQAQPDWQVVGEACDGLQALEKTAELRPDVVLLDIGMPILDGIKAAKRIRQQSPNSKILFLTQDGDNDIQTAALNLGAEGYVLKSKAASELVPTISAALNNNHNHQG